MEEIGTGGLDIAKSVFQIHGIDAAGEVIVRRQLKRRQVLQFFAALKPDRDGGLRYKKRPCATLNERPSSGE